MAIINQRDYDLEWQHAIWDAVDSGRSANVPPIGPLSDDDDHGFNKWWKKMILQEDEVTVVDQTKTAVVDSSKQEPGLDATSACRPQSFRRSLPTKNSLPSGLAAHSCRSSISSIFPPNVNPELSELYDGMRLIAVDYISRHSSLQREPHTEAPVIDFTVDLESVPSEEIESSAFKLWDELDEMNKILDAAEERAHAKVAEVARLDAELDARVAAERENFAAGAPKSEALDALKSKSPSIKSASGAPYWWWRRVHFLRRRAAASKAAEDQSLETKSEKSSSPSIGPPSQPSVLARLARIFCMSGDAHVTA
ncbi:hypothetical protein MSAN_00333300 [Mycena sanguinolenta]|uniref:Uncharacterized protein n=1 Tax=Mycena sanguinolenta TaxID=230812 RepID=A0A8H6ZBJ2_9AGAR|nr:hypothetical protein MSAN_00333300 [Mycena sanguinolenta]